MTDHVTHFISHTTVYRALNVKQQRFSYFPIVLCTFYWVYINVTVQPRFHAAGARAQTKNPFNERYHNIWSGQQHNSYSGWQDEDFKLCCLLLLKMFSENRFLASCLLTTTVVPNSIHKLQMYYNTFKRLLNRFFIIVFCSRQQPFYSTELDSTSETN